MQKYNFFSLFTIMIMVSCLLGACKSSSHLSCTLFGMGEDGSQFYRIPALVKTSDGALVAVADRRGPSLGDLPNVITIVSKRSTDGGRTWSDRSIVAKGDTVRGVGYGDAVVIADEETGNLVAVFSGDNGLWASHEKRLIRTYCVISTDGGKTWGPVRDITEEVYGGVYGNGMRYGLFTGSGSGLQLQSGPNKGRLLLVVAARNDEKWGGSMSNYAIYSDDHGRTWKASANAACSDGDEAKVVEVGEDEVLMSIRNRHKGYRLFSRSKDGGVTWSAPELNVTLPDPACNGDIISHTYQGKHYLLQSLPASSTTREHVSIYLSTDQGATWQLCRRIFNGYSAYSSLQIIDDRTLGIVVEEGKWDGGLPGEDGFQLVFYRFPFQWLLDGLKSNSAF